MPSSVKSSASMMLSRSNSAYQPLDSELGGGGGIVSSVAPAISSFEEEDLAHAGHHEMTSIAVISSAPPTGPNATSNSRVNTQLVMKSGGGVHPSVAAAPVHDFALSGGEEKTSWTNFHFIMCVGIMGFFVFWILLLCRMYLPPDYAFWNFGGGADEVVAPPPPPPEEIKVKPVPVQLEVDVPLE